MHNNRFYDFYISIFIIYKIFLISVVYSRKTDGYIEYYFNLLLITVINDFYISKKYLILINIKKIKNNLVFFINNR